MPPIRHLPIKIFLVALLLPLISGCQLGANAQQSEPIANAQRNIIFIITDDMNDYVGFLGGHPQAYTPNLDRLAEKGAVFLNAQVNSPVCGPSRASLLSGLSPVTTGYYGYNFIQDHWRNNESLNKAVTFPEFLRSEGYDVLTTGKIWHNHQEDPTIHYEVGAKPSWGPWPWDGANDDRYAFGQVAPWPNHSAHPKHPDGYYHDLAYGSLDEIPNVPANPENQSPGYEGWRLHFRPFHYKSEKDRDRMPDELSADWAIEKLKERRENPFLMMIGFNRPHTPLYIPQEFLDMHPLDDVMLAERFPDDLSDLAPDLHPENSSLVGRGYAHSKYNRIISHGGDDELRRWTQAYLASISFVDHQVGRILEALNSSEYAESTYVVFTSDHGYHLGEKLMLHKNTPWEESARVPLLIAGPEIVQKRIVEPVSLIDLYPTFINWSGAQREPNEFTNGISLDGSNLSPLLSSLADMVWEGSPGALTSVASSKELALGEPGEAENQHHSLRTERFRYILSANGNEELYDHKRDPNEWKNVANDDEYFEDLQVLRVIMQNTLTADN